MDYRMNDKIHKWFPKTKYKGHKNNNSNNNIAQYDDDNTFRVLNYNILSPTLLKQTTGKDDSYISNNYYLNWNNRLNKILVEIQEIAPDVICFEEYENDSQFNKGLIDLGFEIAFKLRKGNNNDGCSIAWKKSKFIFLDVYSIDFKLQSSNNGMHSHSQEMNIYSKDNIALFAMLRIKKTNELLSVICTHLLFNPKRGEIKLGQIHQIIEAIDVIKHIYHKNELKIVFGCDVNSAPSSGIYDYITKGRIDLKGLDRYSLSGQQFCHRKQFNNIYSMLNQLNVRETFSYHQLTLNSHHGHNNSFSKQRKDNDSLQWYKQINFSSIEYDKRKRILTFKALKLNPSNTHTNNNSKFILKSKQVLHSAYHILYKKALENDSSNDDDAFKDKGIFINKKRERDDVLNKYTLEPTATFYSNQLIGTFDYIFHSNNLIPIKALSTPSLNYLSRLTTSLPNKTHPSDHFPIAVDFLL